MFTTTLELESGEGWYNQLVDLIEKQQTAPIWMSETKVRSGDIFVIVGFPSLYVLSKYPSIIYHSRRIPPKNNFLLF